MFLNEFRVKEIPTKLQLWTLNPDPIPKRKDGPYVVAAIVARELTEFERVPVASNGSFLVTPTDVSLPDMQEIIIEDVIPIPVTVGIEKGDSATSTDQWFPRHLGRYLNRHIAYIMKDNGYSQVGRNFFDPEQREVMGPFLQNVGIKLRAQVYTPAQVSTIADPITELRSQRTLLQSLQRELSKRKIPSWREVGELHEEINNLFKSRAYRLRSLYTEPGRRSGDPSHISYRFEEFDFSRSVADNKSNQRENVLSYHRRLGRKIEPDQPIVVVKRAGGTTVDHAPELLEEVVSLESMKRYYPKYSKRAQQTSLMDSNDRYYQTKSMIQTLVDVGFICEDPDVVKHQSVAPVVLTMGDDYLEVSTNRDFRRYYEMGKIHTRPNINSFHLFATKEDEVLATELSKVIFKIAHKFGVVIPEVQPHLLDNGDLITLEDLIIQTAHLDKFSLKDLAVIVAGMDSREGEIFYQNIKGYSLHDQVFPTQFFKTTKIADALAEETLEETIGCTVFPQIVAKCSGVPFGLRKGFAPFGSIFLGIDRHTDSFERKASVNAAAAVFGDSGEYICATAVSFDSAKDDQITNIQNLTRQLLRKVQQSTTVKYVFIIRDTGPAQFRYIPQEAEIVMQEIEKIGAKGVYLTSNKSSNRRIYDGDPTDEFGANRPTPFTVCTDLSYPNEFLVLSTEPIITKDGAELGTPVPILYRIIKNTIQQSSSTDGTKETIARSLAWLCRHSWCSPTSTRLPVPVDYAHKLASLVAKIGKSLSPQAEIAPLYI